MGRKVVIGMSGGVDSSVAAWLLKEQGYEVYGVTMRIWQEEGRHHADTAAEDAAKVAEKLGISHREVDFSEIFRRKVVDYFTAEYRQGRTPNPCVVCNHFVKWQALLDYAKSLGADLVATGHYARVEQLPDGRYTIRQAASVRKDQTYALCFLTQDQLAHTLMPLGEYDKGQIREIAARLELPVAEKPDSQDICFIPDGDHLAFMERYSGEKAVPGDFVTADGQVLGRHQGICAYTIGQRKGLGLAMGHPVFVTALDPQANRVVIGENEDLFSRQVVADHVSLMGLSDGSLPGRYSARIRYHHQASPCCAYIGEDGRMYVTFDEAQRAITPGQAVVLYRDQCIMAAGLIRNPEAV